MKPFGIVPVGQGPLLLVLPLTVFVQMPSPLSLLPSHVSVPHLQNESCGQSVSKGTSMFKTLLLDVHVSDFTSGHLTQQGTPLLEDADGDISFT